MTTTKIQSSKCSDCYKKGHGDNIQQQINRSGQLRPGMEWNGNDVINDYGMPTPRID